MAKFIAGVLYVVGFVVGCWSGFYCLRSIAITETAEPNDPVAAVVALNLGANMAVAMCSGLLLIAVAEIVVMLDERLTTD